MKRILAFSAAVLAAVALLAGCSSKKTEYVVLDEALSDEVYAIGFRKDDQTLRDAVQQALVELKKEGKAAEISNTWFGEDITTIPDQFTPTESSDDSLAKIKEKGEFILGLDDSFPPMGYDDNGEIVGFDIDLAKAVCEKLGVKLKLQPINWDQNVSELNGGNIDCIWNGMSVDPERAAAMNLSEPYMENRQVVVTLKANNINSLADLKGKSVILQAGSTAVKALDGRADVKSSLKDGKASEVENNVLAMYELSKGTGDAVVMDEIVARYYIAHMTELKDAAAQG